MFAELIKAAEEVKADLTQQAKEIDGGFFLPQVLGSVHESATTLILSTMIDMGGHQTKEQLACAIDLAGGDFLPYSGARFEQAISGEFVPTDPIEIMVINYIISMRARLDKIWESMT